jgi:hypothetical protein
VKASQEPGTSGWAARDEPTPTHLLPYPTNVGPSGAVKHQPGAVLYCRKAQLEVGDDVADGLEADGEPDQAGCHAACQLLGFVELAMGG